LLNLSDLSPVDIADEAHADNLQSLIEENTKLKSIISECQTRLRTCQEATKTQNSSEQPEPDTNPNEIVQQIIASNGEKSRLQDENESLKSARKTLETDIASIQFHSEYLQRDFEELKETNDQLNEKLEACNNTIQQHLLTIDTLKQELNETKEACEKSLEIHSRQSIVEVEGKELEIARVSKELAEKSENLESEIEMVVELRKQLTKAQADLQEAEICCQQKTEETEENRKELLRCQEVCDLKAAELNLLHEENLELKSEVKRMRAEIDETVTELQHVEGKKIVDFEEKIARISETLEKSVQPLTPILEIPHPTTIENPLNSPQNITPPSSVNDLQESPSTTADIAQRETEIQNLIDDIDQSVHEEAETIPIAEYMATTADMNHEDVENTLEQLAQQTMKTKELEQQVRDLEAQLVQTEATNTESINDLQQEIGQLKKDIVQYQEKAKELEELSAKMSEEISRKNDLIKGE
jgi:chromosome segregation ATPase